MLKTDKSYIIIGGFGASGSSAVRDYLLEFDNVHRFSSEFWLFRVFGGLTTLYRELYIYSSDSMQRYYALEVVLKNLKKLVHVKYNRKSIFYSKPRINLLTDKFNQILESFSDEITVNFIYAYSFHLDLLKPIYHIRFERLLIVFSRILVKLRITRKYFTPVKKVRLISTDVEVYRTAVASLLDKSIITNKSLIMLMSAESHVIPFDTIDLLPNGKGIFVFRDLRDVYVTSIITNRTWLVGDSKNRSNSAEIFVEIMKNYLKNIDNLLDNKKILLIRFEDLVKNYDQTTNKINKFLNITSDNHVSKGDCFNPEVSVKSIGIYKNYPNKLEIRYIEKELREYFEFAKSIQLDHSK